MRNIRFLLRAVGFAFIALALFLAAVPRCLAAESASGKQAGQAAGKASEPSSGQQAIEKRLKEIVKNQEQILANQDAILKKFDAVMEELRIVKVRISLNSN